jgi:hypothetical protein
MQIKKLEFLPIFIFSIVSIIIIAVNKTFWEDESLYAESTAELFNNFSFFPSIDSNIQNHALTKLALFPYFIFAKLFGPYEYVFRMVSFIFGFFTLFFTIKLIKIIYHKVDILNLIALSIFPPFILASTENITIIWLLFFCVSFIYFYLKFYLRKLSFKKLFVYTIIISIFSPILPLLFSIFLIFNFIFNLKSLKNKRYLYELKLLFATFIIIGYFILQTGFFYLDWDDILLVFLKFPYQIVRIFNLFISYFSYYFFIPIFLLPLILFNLKNIKYRFVLFFFLSIFIFLSLLSTLLELVYSYPTRGIIILSFIYLILLQPNNKSKKFFLLPTVILVFLYIIHLIPFVTNHSLYLENNILSFKDLNYIKYENIRWYEEKSKERIMIQFDGKFECFSIDLNKKPSKIILTYFDLRHFGDFKIPYNYSWEDNMLYLSFEPPFKELNNHTIFIYFSSEKPENESYDFKNCTIIKSYKLQKKQNNLINFFNENIFNFKTHPLFHEDYDWKHLAIFLNESIKERRIIGNHIDFYVSLPSALKYYLSYYNLSLGKKFFDLHRNVIKDGLKNVTEILNEKWYGERWFVTDNSRYWWQLRENEKNKLDEYCERFFFPKILIFRCIYIGELIKFKELSSYFLSVNKTILNSKPVIRNYIENADLIYPLISLKDWQLNGFVEVYENTTKRSGIVILHPLSINEPRYIETPYFVLPRNGFIVIGFSNLAGKLSYAKPCLQGQADNGFLVYIVKDGEKFLLDEFVLSASEGWKDVAYSIKDLSNFHGSEIKIRIESWAGGDLSWCGEWGAIDYIDVVL